MTIVDDFITKFSETVDQLKYGLPWEDHSILTPLPESLKAKIYSRFNKRC